MLITVNRVDEVWKNTIDADATINLQDTKA